MRALKQPRSDAEVKMLISEPLPFVTAYLEALDSALKAHSPRGSGLSVAQRRWLGFCVMAVLITNSVCWAKFERAGLGSYSLAALSWMFRCSKLPWGWLLQLSVEVVLRRYGLTEGCLSLDDSDKRRSKVTRKIAYVHKLKDKTSGGYIQGQCLLFLVLITPKVTIPVGFAFYQPDPLLSAWTKEEKRLKKAGVPARQRPPKPSRHPNYPSKIELALALLKRFEQEHPQIHVKCVLADALYGTKPFLQQASELFGGVQVISQLRSNQNIRFRGRLYSLEQYFAQHPGVAQTIRIRGAEPVTVTVGSARLVVYAHGEKRFVIALKYEGEENYRYLVATDLSWRTLDIVQAYTFRWLVEVFFSDWKAHEGWGALTQQPGEDGSSRSLILSLLVDHSLLLHPDQLAQVENQQPAFTVGSLISRVKMDSLVTIIRQLVVSDEPEKMLQHLTQQLEAQCQLKPSDKHMVHRDLGRMEPTPSLKYRAAA
jgi:hypothetical protein